MWYRFSKKIINAEEEQDPLGIGDIKPTELSDDPDVKKLNSLVKSGLMSESEFMDELSDSRPDLIQQMLSMSQMPNFHEIERIVSNLTSQGIKVNPKDRDILAKFYEITADVYLDFIKELESNFAYILRNMVRKRELPASHFGNIDNHNAGMLLGELIDPSTKEEYLTREYLELRSAGIDLNSAVQMITDGDFSNINDAFSDFIERYIDILAQKASRATRIQFYPEDIERKFEEKNINLDNLNNTVEDSLAELYYSYVS